MGKKMMLALLCLTIATPALAVREFESAPAANPNQKGSLLYYPNVEIKYDFQGNLFLDTYLEITNDSNDATYVQLYFVNGDDPIEEEVRAGTFPFELIERTHPGWNFVDAQILLTANHSTWWCASSGQNEGGDPLSATLQVPPFGNLDSDPGFGPEFVGDGRPDPDLDYLGVRTVRGFVVGWAVNVAGEEVTHNHLTGKGLYIDYLGSAAAEYNATAFRRLTDDASDGNGVLLLDGLEYQTAPGRLLLEFYSVPTAIFSDYGVTLAVDTDLTVMPVRQNFKLSNEDGPVSTFVQADIWNQNETRFSGAGRCISCWDQTLLSAFQGRGILAGNHFLRDNIGTDKGKARLTGKQYSGCVGSSEEPIIGIANKWLLNSGAVSRGDQDPCVENCGPSFSQIVAVAGSPLKGMGSDDSASIEWDIIDPGQELEVDNSTRKNREELNRRSSRGTRN